MLMANINWSEIKQPIHQESTIPKGQLIMLAGNGWFMSKKINEIFSLRASDTDRYYAIREILQK